MPVIKICARKLLFLVLTLFLSSCMPGRQYSGPVSEIVMGTVCTINLFDRGTPALYSRVFARLKELENIFSFHIEDSDLNKVNLNAGIAPVMVNPELIEVLAKAMEYAEKSGGYFDPSIGPLVKLWGIGGNSPRVPNEEEIKQTLDLVNYREIEIDKEEGTVFLKRRGMILDLGAIAKGYAADELSRLLALEGLERGIIDLGGDIFALGEREDGAKWRIGIQDPRDDRGSYFGILEIQNKSVVTSGIYERSFVEEESRYHHILSTLSGYPVDNGLLSVTVVADNAIDADALSTAAFALGWETGFELIAQVPGAAVIFVSEDLTVRLSEGMEKYFTISSNDYNFAVSMD